MPEYSVFHVQVDKCIPSFLKIQELLCDVLEIFVWNAALCASYAKGHAALSLLCC